MPGDVRLTYIGGPTLLLQLGGLRLLSDPTFDPAGAEFRAGAYVLPKTHGPGLSSTALGHVDAVLQISTPPAVRSSGAPGSS